MQRGTKKPRLSDHASIAAFIRGHLLKLNYNQAAMEKSSITNIIDYRNSSKLKGSDKGKEYFRILTKHGNDIDIGFDEMHHMSKHKLSDEQLLDIVENIENIVNANMDVKKRGSYGGYPLQVKIKTALGAAGVAFEFLPSSRVFIKTMFYDQDDSYSLGFYSGLP